MNFGFSEEQREVQNLARQIFTDLVSPEKLKASDDYAGERFDEALWGKLAEAGLLGVALEEQYAGMGFGFTELALLVEEVGRSIAPAPVIPNLVSGALPVQRFGTDEQKQRLLPGVAEGKLMLTAALMEKHNENPASPRLTTAVAKDGGYSVSGTKLCVPFAHRAERMIVSAKTDNGVIALLVDPKADGVTLNEMKVTTYEPQYEVALKDVSVAAEDVLAGADKGAEVMQWLTEHTTAALCAHQVGVTDCAMRMTASYTAERKQFGVPVATFQAVGHRAANCFIDVECLRLNTYQAVSRLAGGHNATNEVQIAKIWAGDVGHRVSYASQHLHGGMGIDRDYPLWRYCTWMRHNEMMLGSSAKNLAALGKRIAAGEAYCQ
ncbi:alkylation response protein AidB-like acyl-CoA dehydrogenase [Litorivivens lipolytica]|uniref:Alkylation response protein AidB-like acyl-CoA dehydrogenase n=1 Tax=Litorivivens lipolytica TaxID=1524264 RepID=A0A7W4Z4W6_9GAMM|nr:acyl-CoA dehydrogenase family protein [Litorivivens lipolytica]MBB3046909.1 alkylation response protein AidB-like acyl-CoA dehydrogenase [Litorivivens lipolytica]